jgi:hypothetical protein
VTWAGAVDEDVVAVLVVEVVTGDTTVTAEAEWVEVTAELTSTVTTTVGWSVTVAPEPTVTSTVMGISLVMRLVDVQVTCMVDPPTVMVSVTGQRDVMVL